MSSRYDITNTGGVTKYSGGNMPQNTHTNQTTHTSRLGKGTSPASPTVIGSGHPVEVDGDGGCWDTVTGQSVNRHNTTLDSSNV